MRYLLCIQLYKKFMRRTKFERRYYKDKETEEYLYLTDMEIEDRKEEDKQLERDTKHLENRLKKIENTKTYIMNQWSGIELHEKT